MEHSQSELMEMKIQEGIENMTEALGNFYVKVWVQKKRITVQIKPIYSSSTTEEEKKGLHIVYNLEKNKLTAYSQTERFESLWPSLKKKMEESIVEYKLTKLFS